MMQRRGAGLERVVHLRVVLRVQSKMLIRMVEANIGPIVLLLDSALTMSTKLKDFSGKLAKVARGLY